LLGYDHFGAIAADDHPRKPADGLQAEGELPQTGGLATLRASNPATTAIGHT
jgi:hypothetical protein